MDKQALVGASTNVFLLRLRDHHCQVLSRSLLLGARLCSSENHLSLVVSKLPFSNASEAEIRGPVSPACSDNQPLLGLFAEEVERAVDGRLELPWVAARDAEVGVCI